MLVLRLVLDERDIGEALGLAEGVVGVDVVVEGFQNETFPRVNLLLHLSQTKSLIPLCILPCIILRIRPDILAVVGELDVGILLAHEVGVLQKLCLHNEYLQETEGIQQGVGWRVGRLVDEPRPKLYKTTLLKIVEYVLEVLLCVLSATQRRQRQRIHLSKQAATAYIVIARLYHEVLAAAGLLLHVLEEEDVVVGGFESCIILDRCLVNLALVHELQKGVLLPKRIALILQKFRLQEFNFQLAVVINHLIKRRIGLHRYELRREGQ